MTVCSSPLVRRIPLAAAWLATIIAAVLLGCAHSPDVDLYEPLQGAACLLAIVSLVVIAAMRKEMSPATRRASFVAIAVDLAIVAGVLSSPAVR